MCLLLAEIGGGFHQRFQWGIIKSNHLKIPYIKYGSLIFKKMYF